MNQAEEFLKKWYPTVKMNDKWDRELPIISWDDCLEIMQAYTDQQLQLHNVVNCKTPKKVAVVGCGDSGLSAARLLAEKGVETIIVNDLENSPLTLKDIAPPKEIEPLVLKQTLPDNYFNKPQNRAERRKKKRSKGKKRKG